MNTLPYELIVQESIKTAQQLKGKSIGISRLGSSSDVIARVFLKNLGLEPDRDVTILQVGGSGERVAASLCEHRALPRHGTREDPRPRACGGLTPPDLQHMTLAARRAHHRCSAQRAAARLVGRADGK